ncbi:MAG TPA: zinc ribbon domain-containing protein [Nitrososphaerales archaeon]|nr:zinc ribbon domain-containing protein [Nitrososphaerales archaeon]
MATCPNCAREVTEDVTNCTFCGALLNPKCPSCGREVQADYAICPYCGFNLSSARRSELSSVKERGSMAPTLVIVLTFVGVFIDILQGASESTYDYANYSFRIPPPVFASDLFLVQVVIGAALVLLAIVQLVVAYGLASGKSFSLGSLLRLVSLAFLLSVVELSLDILVSRMVSLERSVFYLDIFFVMWSLLLVVVVWRSVNQVDEREILSQTAPIGYQG